MILLAACVWTAIGCGPGWVLNRGASSAADGSSPLRESAALQEPVERVSPPEVDPPTRCARACLHIVELSRVEPSKKETRVWLEDCSRRCEDDAAKGRLDCYERSTTAADLEFCMSP